MYIHMYIYIYIYYIRICIPPGATQQPIVKFVNSNPDNGPHINALIHGFSHGLALWGPESGPQYIRIIYHIQNRGAHRTDPTRIKRIQRGPRTRAQRKTLELIQPGILDRTLKPDPD